MPAQPTATTSDQPREDTELHEPAQQPALLMPLIDEAQALLDRLPLDEPIPAAGRLPHPHRIVLPQAPWFVGRTAELRCLAADFKAGHMTLVLAGTPGIGKTQLAAEFAYRYGHYFAGGVFWMSCDEPEDLPDEIAACGEAAALDLFRKEDALPLEERVRRVQSQWALDIPRLLIFDRCEDPYILAKYRPRGTGCRVLVTSRQQNWSQATIQPLDVLARSDSVSLLRQLVPSLSNTEAHEIAASLGDLPLSLHLTTNYLVRWGTSWETVHTPWRQ